MRETRFLSQRYLFSFSTKKQPQTLFARFARDFLQSSRKKGPQSLFLALRAKTHPKSSFQSKLRKKQKENGGFWLTGFEGKHKNAISFSKTTPINPSTNDFFPLKMTENLIGSKPIFSNLVPIKSSFSGEIVSICLIACFFLFTNEYDTFSIVSNVGKCVFLFIFNCSF